jgi:hypothetical protein
MDTTLLYGYNIFVQPEFNEKGIVISRIIAIFLSLFQGTTVDLY